MRKIFIIIILVLFGTSCHHSNSVIEKPRDNRDRWKALALFIKKHYGDSTDMTVKEIAAEMAYQEYLMNEEKLRAKASAFTSPD